MRYYLDTNVLFFMFQREEDRIDHITAGIIHDYANQLCTSVVCVAELLQLEQTRAKKIKNSSTRSIVQWLQDNGITIVYITPKHLHTYETLPVFGDHRDVVDKLLIAQTITDKATVVSSDNKFTRYVTCGLHLHRNRP